jgi:colanic acid/amylovoran biosynthesis glycosyltransferase
MDPMTMDQFKDQPADAGSGVVAHIHDRFFEKSETFIHNVTANLRRFYPVFIAWDYRNLEQFPIPPADRFSLTLSPGSWRWLLQGSGRRFLGRELPAERFLKKRHARLLHAHFGHDGVWALRLKRALHLPLVTTFYGHDMSQASSLASWKKGYQALFNEGDLFLVEGPHMKRRLGEIGCPAEKIEIQRIAIPVTHLPFRSRRPKGRGETTILLFSGRFVEKKGLAIALRALREVRRAYSDFEFRIIGDGPLKPEIERQVRDNEMSTYVRLLGFLDYKDYREQMANADLFLHPSITAADGDSEGGAPTVILEAQALGLPVISTRHADIPNVVIPGVSALLSDEQDIPGLAANILRLLKEPDSWARMGEAGRRQVEENHDVARETPRLETRYAELITSHER